MFDAENAPNTLPTLPGAGYKPQHYSDLIADPGCVGWLEVHAENYMGDGGRPIAQLRQLAEKFPISVHGVGLSIGAETALDKDHLSRLSNLVSWLNPTVFSEHLAWSTHEGAFLNDLLPLPYTAETLARICDHVDQLQNTIGRQMMLENPSSYLAFDESTWSEPDFLREISNRTGCGLLLDVNNVFVSATNLSYDPRTYIDEYPLDKVGEIHLGGHDEDEDDHGRPLLIDSHGAAIVDPVWALLDHTLTLSGPRPILIEWDTDVPEWPLLHAEASRAKTALTRVTA
ncbi:DUF692 domain-containing protein [Shimia sp.]|uniref:MNIO family bufferin maturase n=1 Tax=Shimia sp. TaxID=1954381 RepID=UPI003B8E869E